MSDITVAKGFSLAPASFDEAIRYAEYLAKSDLVPKDYQGKPANIVVATAWGAELGLHTMQALASIAVINGRGSIWGDAALALVMARPDFEDIQETIEGEGDDRVAVCIVKRKGRSPVVRRFSVADAKRAGLWSTSPTVRRYNKDKREHYEVPNDSPWYKYPERMLQMRPRGFALRDSFPDALRGFKLTEELQEERDITDQVEIVQPSRAAVVMPQEKPAADAVKQENEWQPEPERVLVDGDTGEVVYQAATEAPAQPVEQPKQPAPAAGPAGEPCITAGAARIIRAKLATSGLEESAFCKHWGIDSIEALPMSKANEAMDWAKKGGAQS